MKRTYHNCAKIRHKIDSVLEKNNIDVANTIENNISDEDKEDLLERCGSRLLNVYDLDRDFVKTLLNELDHDIDNSEEE